MYSPLKEKETYYLPNRSLKSEKYHHKSASISTDIPSSYLTNNFELHKNCTQNLFYTQEFYHSQATLLNLTHQKIHVNNQFTTLNNRISLLKKKKELSEHRCRLKSINVKEFLEKQSTRSEFLQEKQRVLKTNK